MAQKDKSQRGARGAGTVFYSSADGCWRWRAVTGHKAGGGVSYTSGRSRTQAAAVRAKQAAEKSGQQPHESRETVGAFLDHWLEDIAKPNVRESTWASYERVCRLHLKPRIGGVPLRHLTVTHVAKLWAALGREAGLSPGGVRKCSEVLATALEAAVAAEKIPVAPTRKAPKPKVDRPDIEVFTDAEVKAIMKAAKGDRLEALYLLALGTGAREGELLAIESQDFDLTAGTMRVARTVDSVGGKFIVGPPKSRSGLRTVSLPAFAVDAVRRHLAGRRAGPLFTTASGNYFGRSNFIRDDWAPLLERAGLTYRKFHTLRHTHASRLLADNQDPAEVARRIGDRVETVMRVYAHWIDVRGRDTAARVDAIYGPAGP